VGRGMTFRLNTGSDRKVPKCDSCLYLSNGSTYEVHIWWVGGAGQDLSTEYRVGPKGTEMRFMLISFERQHLRSSYLVSRSGGARPFD
jgi:hypothetical protein